MQVKFGGVAKFDAPDGKVRNFARNLELVASCVPDSTNFVKKDDSHFTLDVKVGIGAINGLFTLDCTMTSQSEDEYTYSFRGSGAGSEMHVSLEIKISGKSGNLTEVEWSSAAELKGVISGLGEPIIRQLTQKKIDEILSNAKSKIDAM